MKFRDANEQDLPSIIGLLADDILGAEREIVSDPVAPAYVVAFRDISGQGGNRWCQTKANWSQFTSNSVI